MTTTEQATTGRPNVLLVTLDQWRAECLSASGHPLVRTPNLDRVASTGARFARHHAQAAPCGPSRASLFTGLYPHNHRSVENGTPLDARFTNLALELRTGGYDPVLFGYTDTTVDPRTVPADDPRLTSYEGVLPGFRVEAELREDRLPWLAWLKTQHYDLDGAVADYMVACRRWTWDLSVEELAAPAPFAAEHSETAWLTDRALDYLDGAPEPWCAHVAFIRPHPPFIAPAPYHQLHDPADVAVPIRHRSAAEEAEVHPFMAAVLGSAAFRAPADEKVARQMRATYYGMIAEVDHHVGRLMDRLDASGAAARTIVVVTSDHGEMLGDHWLQGKLGFHDESYRVPLLVRAPGAAPGVVVGHPTEHVDILPTVLELAGLPEPLQGDGRSLVPFLAADAPSPWRDAARWEFEFRHVGRGQGWDPRTCSLTAQRHEREKYVHFAGLPPLFFDLDDDPHQLVNRAADPRYRDRVLEHTQQLLTWELTTRNEALADLLVTARGLVRLSHLR